MIIREVKLANKNLLQALSNAKSLILNNLNKELDVAEYNYIRFAEPEILITSFEFDKQDNALTGDKIQFSFAWKIRNGQVFAVVSGEANQDFSAFTPYSSGIFTEEEFKEYQVKTYDEFIADMEKAAANKVEAVVENSAENTEKITTEEKNEGK